MKIEYELRSEDVAAFNVDHLKRDNKLMKKLKRKRLIVTGLYMFSALICYILGDVFWPFALFLFFLGGLWWAFYLKWWEYKMKRQVIRTYKRRNQKKPEDKGMHELNFKDSYIYAKNEEDGGKVPWKDIFEAVIRDDYIFLYMSECDAIIIPRRRLDEEYLWGDLCDFVKETFAEHGHKPLTA